MDFMPDEETPQHTSPRLARAVLVASLGVAVLLGGATVLARPPSAGPAAARAPATDHAVAPAAFHRIANGGTDTGPGEAESELAILPQTRR
ncbi:MAG: hypothetical protein ACXWLP_00290 [Myxococcaceae bacterium]